MQSHEKYEGPEYDALLGNHDVINSNLLFTWHIRLGHTSLELIKQFVEAKWINIPNFAQLAKNIHDILCIGCLKAAQKNHKHPWKTAQARNATRGN